MLDYSLPSYVTYLLAILGDQTYLTDEHSDSRIKTQTSLLLSVGRAKTLTNLYVTYQMYVLYYFLDVSPVRAVSIGPVAFPGLRS